MSVARRRTSYAAAVSGNFATSAAHSSSSTVDSANPPSSSHPPPATLLRSDLPRSYPGAAAQDNWDRTTPASYSQGLAFGQQENTFMDDRGDEIVVPSYLRGSRYVERLRERLRQRRNSPSNSKASISSQPGSLSTSASNMSLQKMVPSHRGMTHEIVERPFPQAEDRPLQLPSRMSVTDRAPGLELSPDGLEVKFAGPSKQENEAASIRADHPMPKDCGIYYFEVTLQGKQKDGLVGIGFSGPKASLNRPPGWEPDSWAYHGDDGLAFCQSTSKTYGPKFNWNSTVGCGINFRTGTVFFTKDGINLGTAFREVRDASLFPSIGMKKAGEHARVNFGQSPFVFDIDTMVELEREMAMGEIEAHDPLSLHPSRDEASMLREMVSQYLQHEGYVETAKAFSLEHRRQDYSMQGEDRADGESEYREDVDASQRQRIRSSILQGDINMALKHTDLYYPHVLKENENIDFKLKCRKFVEMIRKCSELSSKGKQKGTTATKASKMLPGTNGHQAEFGVFDNAMEIDTKPEAANGNGNGASAVGVDDFIKSETLMSEALLYGQALQAEFRDDPRREVKQALEDTFALIAYNNVEESSLAPLLREEGRVTIAEELNSAILVSLGKASSSAIERLVQQSEVLISDLAAEGHLAAHVNIRSDYMRGTEARGE